jgi:microcompartment protein CcmL/EutN
MTGDVSAVTASVDAGIKSAEGTGMVLDSVVIAHPDPELYRHLL